MVPYDIRRDWLREWRAEFAYAAARAARINKPMPIASLPRAGGAILHAAWLRWDRWRVEMIIQDIKHALRSLRRKPSFTAVVVLTLAIGIGGTTAIFGAVNAVLLRPLPYPSPDQIVRVYKTSLERPDRIGGTVSPPDFTDWRRDNSSFTELAAYDNDSHRADGPRRRRADSHRRSDRRLLCGDGNGAAPGRAISTDDDPMGARNVVVLSHAIWIRRFGSNPAIVGQQVTLDGVSSEVIGVMPEGFQYPLRSEMWIPLRFSARDLETQRGAHYIEVVGRLKPDVPLQRAREDMRAIAAQVGRSIFRGPIATTPRRCIRCANRWSATFANRCSSCLAPSAWCC